MSFSIGGDRTVNRLGFGAMRITGDGVWGPPRDHDESIAVLRRAIELGVNLIDTAESYGPHVSEELIAEALHPYPKDLVIATKGGFDRSGPGQWKENGRPERLREELEGSLRRLQTDYIDLYQIHANDRLTPVEETLQALDILVRQGKVRYIGCSNWHAWKIAKALGISELKNYARFDSLQAYYSIAGRDLERDIVPLLESEGTALLVWSPLAGGLLSGKFSRENQRPENSRRSEFDFPIVDKERAWNILDAIAPIAKAHNCSAARVSLAWLLTRPFVTSVIIGAKRMDQLQDNLAAVDVKFSPEEIRVLDEVSALPPEYPGWMVDFQGIDRLGPTEPRFEKYSTAAGQK